MIYILKVVIYKTPNCQKCNFTAKKFERAGFIVTIKPVNANIIEYMHKLNWSIAPLVQIFNDNNKVAEWHDLDLPKIEKVIQQYKK